MSLKELSRNKSETLHILCIRCGKVISTGIGISRSLMESGAVDLYHNSTNCPYCGKMNTWDKSDAFYRIQKRLKEKSNRSITLREIREIDPNDYFLRDLNKTTEEKDVSINKDGIEQFIDIAIGPSFPFGGIQYHLTIPLKSNNYKENLEYLKSKKLPRKITKKAKKILKKVYK
jgi:hypothetical protein